MTRSEQNDFENTSCHGEGSIPPQAASSISVATVVLDIGYLQLKDLETIIVTSECILQDWSIKTTTHYW